jgi:hypothetical protein
MWIHGLALSALLLQPAPAPNAAPAELVTEVAKLRFYSAFWPNLHHTLYVAAWDRREGRPGPRRLAGKLAEPLTGTLTEEERAAWDAAVDYYDRELASRSLLFDERMSRSIRRALIASPDVPGSGLDPQHQKVLDGAAPVYRRHWWPLHDKANRAWIADVAPRVDQIAKEVVPRLADLYRTPWFTEPARVDAVRAGTWQGAYTMVRPAHATISSGDADNAGWDGAEVVYHELSHQLVLELQDMIDEEARAQGKRAGSLWHAVQFVMTGEVVRQALAARQIEFQPYVYRNNLIDGEWKAFRAPIEQEWMPYVNGKRSFEEALKRLIAAI